VKAPRLEPIALHRFTHRFISDGGPVTRPRIVASATSSR